MLSKYYLYKNSFSCILLLIKILQFLRFLDEESLHKYLLVFGSESNIDSVNVDCAKQINSLFLSNLSNFLAIYLYIVTSL